MNSGINIIYSRLTNRINSLLLHGFIPCFFCFFAISPAASQDVVFNHTLSLNINGTVYSALNEISNKTGYYFSYNSELFDADRHISLQVEDKLLLEILQQIIPDTTLSFKLIGNQIVIFRPLFSSGKNNTDSIQKPVSYIKISGRVIDGMTDEPVPFATIGIVGKSYGTITNNDGEFVLKISPEALNETLGFSCLGYKMLQVPVLRVMETLDKIKLYADYIPIQEVIIRKTDPLALVKTAIENIPENYPDKAITMTTFYRESVKKYNRFVAVAEAALDVYKIPYFRLDNDQIKILKGRKTIDATRYDTLTFKLKAGLYTSLQLDIVKNMPDFLLSENFYNYKYKMTDIIPIDNQSNYVIEFKEKESTSPPMYEGKIYIGLNSLAITGAEFSLNNYGIKEASKFMVIKKPRSMSVKPLGASYKVRYSEMDNKYYIRYLRSETTFRVRKKGKIFSAEYTVISEMVATDINQDDTRRFRSKETARSMDIFTEQLGAYDEEFWEQYNYIKPSQSLLDNFEMK
ncbi:MAG: carboxypeptidase-like regulatory domain-containing protein [Bacteroidales bacterium]|nr:carboxypeptidase-like regulatory domain-containing protein [Bacteroidales bacterium]